MVHRQGRRRRWRWQVFQARDRVGIESEEAVREVESIQVGGLVEVLKEEKSILINMSEV